MQKPLRPYFKPVKSKETQLTYFNRKTAVTEIFSSSFFPHIHKKNSQDQK